MGGIDGFSKGNDVGPGDFIEGLTDKFVGFFTEGGLFFLAGSDDNLFHVSLISVDDLLSLGSELLDPLGGSFLGGFRGVQVEFNAAGSRDVVLFVLHFLYHVFLIEVLGMAGE